MTPFEAPVTYCELGSHYPSTGRREVHERIEGVAAYEHYVLAKYTKEILEARRLARKAPVPLDELPRREKSLFLYELFRFLDFQLTYLELGSTLFEVIDGLELVARTLGETPDLSTGIRYLGIESSLLLREGAVALHPGHRLEYVPDPVSTPPGVDLLYDRAVSAYLFSSVDEFALLLRGVRLGYMNLHLSKGVTFDRTNDVGRVASLLSAPVLCARLGRPLYYLFGRETTESIEGFFLWCPPEDLPRIRALFLANPYLAEFLSRKAALWSDLAQLLPRTFLDPAPFESRSVRRPFHERRKEYLALA